MSDIKIEQQKQVDVTGQENATVEEYLPNQENLYWRYKGEGNEYASFERFLTFSSDHKVQVSEENGGTITTKVFEISKDSITLTYQKEESYHRKNSIDQNNIRDIILKAPIEAGNSWKDSQGNKRYIEAVDVAITTSGETYHTVKVVTEYKDHISEAYFAKHVGLVKQVTRAKDGTFNIVSILEEISQKPQLQKVVLYYPNKDGKIERKEKTVTLNTNESILYPMIRELKTKPKDGSHGVVLTSNVKVNSLILDQNENIIQIDVSKEFISEMNLGAGFESLTIDSFVNSLLDNYGMEEVLLTVEGEPIRTGHILLEVGETLKKNTQDIVE